MAKKYMNCQRLLLKKMMNHFRRLVTTCSVSEFHWKTYKQILKAGKCYLKICSAPYIRAMGILVFDIKDVPAVIDEINIARSRIYRFS